MTRSSQSKRHRARAVACAAVLALLAAAARAQYLPVRFDRVGLEHGLSNGIVSCVLRDRAGFLWVGTEAGLNRYDGYGFKQFLADPKDPHALADGAITALHEDSAGRLWVGTRAGGLHLFDRRMERFRAFRAAAGRPDALSDDRVYRIYEDAKGALWVGTAGGLDKVVGRDDPAGPRVVSYRHDPADPSSLGHNRVTALAEDAAGVLWVGTKKGLNRLVSEDPPRFERFGHDPVAPGGLPDDEVYSLLRDSRGDLWVGMWGGAGAARVPAAEQPKPRPAFVTYPRGADGRPGFPLEIVVDIVEDRRGGLWFCGGDSEILALLPPEERDAAAPRFVTYSGDEGNPFSIGSGSIMGAFEDAQGILWVAALEGGLSRIDPAKSAFRLYRHHAGSVPGLPTTHVSQVLEDRDGSILVGSEGLTRIVPASGRHAQPEFLRPPPGALREPGVGALLRDSRGRLWVGTVNGGLHVGRDAGGPFESFARDPEDPESLGNDTVLALLEDSRGTIWAGTYQGLYRLVEPGGPGDRPRFRAYRHDPGDERTLSRDLVESLAEGPDGAIWVGTASGLNRLDPETGAIERFMQGDGGLPDERVDALLASSAGQLWVGTGAGVCRLDPASRRITRAAAGSPLAGLAVKSLAEDARGGVWAGTINGLFRLDPGGEGAAAFGRNDGLPSEVFFRGAACRGASGTLYFGGPAGLVAFRPEEVEPNRFVPPVVLTELLIANRPQRIAEGSLLPAHVGALGELVLTHADALFAVEFSALDFRQPEENRYAYRLEGLYDEWIETDARNRRATFTNLPPGEYVFRVKAANNDGVWNEAGAALRVVILPPWWRTWWAYALYAGAALGLLFAGVHLRLRALRRRGEELEALVDERTAELAESERRALRAQEEALEASRAKSTFLANMSHELRTPLNAVLGFAEVLERRGTLEGEDRESLAIIQRSGEHLLGLINDVLSISKIEAGRLALSEAPFDLTRLLAAAHEMVRGRAEAKGLSVVFEADPDLPRAVVGDEGKLRQVLVNLLGNAVKFTDEGGVTLRARWEPGSGRARFEVEDTGRGIAEGEIGRLFEAFVQTESGRAAKEGTGLGLVISRQMVRLMGGDMEVRSRAGEGSVFAFEIDLPVSEEGPARAGEARVAGLAEGEAPRRLLVVDDVAENRLLLVRLLASAGFEVREAANGAEALEAWRAWRPDLIFMDMRMPVMDGREATGLIRESEKSSTTKEHEGTRSDLRDPSCSFVVHPTVVVALTASAFEHEREAILAGGADDFVTKPFRAARVFETIARHLGVRYRYDEAGPAAAPGAGDAPSAGRLAALPPALLAELADALGAGDFEGATLVAERARAEDAPLADALLAEIRAFRLDELLTAVERAQAERRTEAPHV